MSLSIIKYPSGGGGGGGSIEGANEGLSLAGTSAVLGQTVGQVGNPAAITVDREIPIGANSISFLGQDSGSGFTGVILRESGFDLNGTPPDANPYLMFTEVVSGNAQRWEYDGNSMVMASSGGGILQLLDNQDVSLLNYPNTRDDSGTDDPLNFLYTNGQGEIRSGLWTSLANQGLSINSVSNKIQLGQPIGAAGNPALLSASVEIPFDTSGLTYISLNYGGLFPLSTFFQPGMVQVTGDSSASATPVFRIQDANTSTTVNISANGSVASISKTGGAPSIVLNDIGYIEISPSVLAPDNVGLYIPNRKIKITDTSEGEGKVLTSDANGVGTWTTPIAHLDAGTATVADVVNALITSGLMAAS